jgi:hypothetical protein
LLDHLVEKANNAEEAATYVLNLSQENPDDPLLFTENWLASSVKQELESSLVVVFEKCELTSQRLQRALSRYVGL